MLKQVRTKNNTYNTVQYDSDGNILTPARRRELRKLNKGKTQTRNKKDKWVKLFSQFQGACFACNQKFYPGTEILWNKKNKKTKHVVCSLNSV